ncbi:hypothetical protein N752_05710 [Desulforamulus aquiferis]|nr:hypothetical protein [Desulforamulus aquiferis]RYD06144.1 hypothetical protein N752_05710 [Desulforamulus aquiferis]
MQDQRLIALIYCIGKDIEILNDTKTSVEKGLESFKNLTTSKQKVEQNVIELINYVKTNY